MVANPEKGPEKIIAENPDYQPMSDSGELEAMIDQVLSEHEQSVQDYLDGKQKAFAFLVGQIMKMTRGKANPKIVNDLLSEKIQKRCE